MDDAVAAYPSVGLIISESDVLSAQHLIHHFPSDCSVYFLHHELSRRAANSKYITKEEFESCFVDANSRVIETLFDVFDRHCDNRVQLSDLCAGASILFPGQLDSKLKFAFQVFYDPAQYGSALKMHELSYRAVWRIIRAFVLVLWAVFGRDIDVAEIDGYATDIVADICSFNKVSRGILSLEQSLSWFNGSAAADVGWSALLDLAAWLKGGQRAMSSQINVPRQFGTAICPYQIAFELKIYCAASVNVDEFWCAFRSYVSSLGLSSISEHYFYIVCKEGIVNLSQFCDLEWGHTGDGVPFILYVYICITLSVLCYGSKSAKLDFAFRLLSSPETSGSSGLRAVLSVDLLTILLLAYMRGLQALASECLGRAQPETFSRVGVRNQTFGEALDDAALLAGAICHPEMSPNVTVTSATNYISFDQFGNWYNDGGFEVAPWLELINLDKCLQLMDKSGSDLFVDESAADCCYEPGTPLQSSTQAYFSSWWHYR